LLPDKDSTRAFDQEAVMPDLIKVLSIDGGGIRGIIPAVILTEIEERTGKAISDLFHLIAGTSTGGILALGLTKPKEDKPESKPKAKDKKEADPKPAEKLEETSPKVKEEEKKRVPEFKAEEMVSLYEQEGTTIFPRSFFKPGWFGAKYPSTGIEKVLKKRFGEARLKEALTDVLITAYDIERRSPLFFKSRKAKANSKKDDFSMLHVARATSAAPTYFQPLKLETKNVGKYATLIDGGVFANNPALCGYVEAKNIYGEKADVLVLSLGTGELNRRLAYETVKDWGKAQWARPILDVVFDGVSIVTDELMGRLLPAPSYYRFQASLDKGNDELDDADKVNIRKLKLSAEDVYQKRQKKEFDALIKLLKAS
jgi:patatin-like phospholipase/acyl hydrolase